MKSSAGKVSAGVVVSLVVLAATSMGLRLVHGRDSDYAEIVPREALHFAAESGAARPPEPLLESAAQGSLPAVNLLANPGFELDADNNTKPDTWSGNSNFTRSSELVLGGSYAGKHFSTANAGYTITQTVSNLAPGTTCSFSGWVNVRPTSDAFTLGLQVRWRTATDSSIKTDTIKTYSGPTVGWDNATSSLVAPVGTAKAQVRMNVSSLNATLYVDDFTFNCASDTTTPTISNVLTSSVTSNSATITWSTNEASDTQVEYGTSTAYGTSSPVATGLVTSHSMTISGLQADTPYHYRAKSADSAGNLAVSEDFIFTTSPAPPPPSTTELLAFPGAQGFGMFNRGGRGGQVIYVTNLNDSGTGSLRAALVASGPRIVLFQVSGTIALQSNVSVSNPFLTIAGNTAPGDGVQIKGAHIDIRTHNVVIRFLRVRSGDELNSSSLCCRGSIYLNGLKGEVYNVMLDHVTTTWGPDNGGVEIVENVRDVTVQYSIIGEGLNKSNHPEGGVGHSTSMRIARNASIWPKRISVHHNLITSSDKRNPQVQDGENIDVVNNVVYNWGTKAGYGAPRSMNLVKNLFVMGPETTVNTAWIPNTSSKVTSIPNNAVYESGNFGDGVIIRGGSSSVYTDTRFEPYSIGTEHEPSQLVDLMVLEAGANLPVRDPADQSTINNLVGRTGRFINGINYGLAWPVLASGPALQDVDLDGMADDWELLHFGSLLRGSPTDSSADFDADGYTDLEEFLNGTNPTVPDR